MKKKSSQSVEVWERNKRVIIFDDEKQDTWYNYRRGENLLLTRFYK